MARSSVSDDPAVRPPARGPAAGYGVPPSDDLPSDWASQRWAWQAALRRPGGPLAQPDELQAQMEALPAEPPLAFWRNKSAYGRWLELGALEPLREAAALGAVPAWLQRAVSRRLAWYYTVDRRPKAPTVAVNGVAAQTFHATVSSILQHISPEALLACADNGVAPEVVHALLSYHHPQAVSAAWVEALDREAGLLRVTFRVHGQPPAETWAVDGQPLAPAWAKWRACNFFGLRLLRQRIVWLPVPVTGGLTLQLDGRPVPVSIGPERMIAPGTTTHVPTDLTLDLANVHRVLPLGRGWGPPPTPALNVKARLVLALARMWPVRRRFKDAWLFVDREFAADDNAEHLYRWVMQHRPGVNAWFVMRRDSADWTRLRADGFRLIEPGLMCRLLMLNARYVVSSHTDYVEGIMDARRYGHAMRWRFAFVEHGISHHDVSHWFNQCQFDLVAASSPSECASFVDDDSGYRLTTREAKFTGFPRHDSLRALATRTLAKDSRLLLVMPTWRGSLSDERSRGLNEVERVAHVRASAFGTQWRIAMNHPRLRALADRYGLQVAFMAHQNLVPVIEALGLPPWMQVFAAGRDKFQPLLCRSVALVTDYTSVAFDMALLRRTVFYYQPDREAFYGGDHNWRPGFFDYDRDGFGPVALEAETLFGHIEAFAARDCRPEAQFLERMERLMPHPARPSCELVFEAMQDLGTPAAKQPAHP